MKLQRVGWFATTMTALFAWCAEAGAQSSSLFGAPGHRRSLTLEDTSFSYVKVEPPKEIVLNDLITVVVDEKQRFYSRGEMDQRKRSNADARLQDWFTFNGLWLDPIPENQRDVRLRGQLNSQFRTQAELQGRDALSFRIACRVVDIRPNGNLVLEGRRNIRNNEEIWEQALTGICRREDVLPNNTVLSEDIYEISVYKRETGHVRDGYRRGWLSRVLAPYNPL
jgi:flagellar L-ring protein FlgH